MVDYGPQFPKLLWQFHMVVPAYGGKPPLALVRYRNGDLEPFVTSFDTKNLFTHRRVKNASVFSTSRILGWRSPPSIASRSSVDPTSSLEEGRTYPSLRVVVHAGSRRLLYSPASVIQAQIVGQSSLSTCPPLKPLVGLEHTTKHRLSKQCRPD